MKFEPVINERIISSLVAAIITCLVAFNVPITDDQRGGLLGLVAVIGVIFFGGAIVTRSNVYPVDKVEQQIIPAAKAAGANEAAGQMAVMSAFRNGGSVQPPFPPMPMQTTPPEGDY